VVGAGGVWCECEGGRGGLRGVRGGGWVFGRGQARGGGWGWPPTQDGGSAHHHRRRKERKTR